MGYYGAFCARDLFHTALWTSCDWRSSRSVSELFIYVHMLWNLAIWCVIDRLTTSRRTAETDLPSACCISFGVQWNSSFAVFAVSHRHESNAHAWSWSCNFVLGVWVINIILGCCWVAIQTRPRWSTEFAALLLEIRINGNSYIFIFLLRLLGLLVEL